MKRSDPKLYLTDEQHRATVQRMRDRIATGALLDLDDSDVPGDKHTSCSWGMCFDGEGFWEKDELLFPDRRISRGFRESKDGKRIELVAVSPKYHSTGQFCPLDRDAQRLDADTRDPWGCFYRCRVFSPAKGTKPPDRTEALRLFDVTLERLRRQS